jgi:hypothetical protein
MANWLEGCEICNAGLVAEMDTLVDSGISVRKAAKIMSEEGERKIGDLVYTEAAIRARYLLHKGKREPHPNKVVHSEPHNHARPNWLDVKDDVMAEPAELSAAHYREASQASAQAKKAKETSELERAATVIKQAARLLERIVEGDIKDNGSEYDRLSAESIRRKGPSIIISYYQLGIDPEKAVNFYKGEKNGKKVIIEGNS